MPDSFKVRYDDILEGKLKELSVYTDDSIHRVGENAIEYFIENNPEIFLVDFFGKLEEIKRKISRFEFEMLNDITTDNILQNGLNISMGTNCIFVGKGASIRFMQPNIIIFKPTVFAEATIPMHKITKVKIYNEEKSEYVEIQQWESFRSNKPIIWEIK